MKKQILTLVAVGALSAISAMAQGTIDLNSFDGAGGAGITLWATNGTMAANNYGNIEVLGGASAGSMTAITSIGLGTAIYPVGTGGAGAGAFDAGYGVVSGVAANSTGFFEILFWSGASDYGSAQSAPGAAYATSGVFQSTTGTVIPPPPGAPIPGTLNAPGDLHLVPATVPEPTSFALAGLGAAALMIFRRRK